METATISDYSALIMCRYALAAAPLKKCACSNISTLVEDSLWTVS